MAKSVIIDTGFWYGLFDPRDKYYTDSNLYFEYLEPHNVVIPWPSLYETINTRFSKKHTWMKSFEKYIKQEKVIKISDSNYRDNALDVVFDETKRCKPYSLVDLIIREMILDPETKIDYLVTFNESDFYDVCATAGIEIFNG